MVPRPLPLLPPPSPQRHEVGARARVAELLQLLSGDTRKVLDEPYQGCPGGIIADEPEEHSLVAEFGMYYKSPEIAPLRAVVGQPARRDHRRRKRILQQNSLARHWAQDWARDWLALALTQVHHGSRLSDSCESGEALSFVHPPTPATGKLIHNLFCDCRVKND